MKYISRNYFVNLIGYSLKIYGIYYRLYALPEVRVKQPNVWKS